MNYESIKTWEDACKVTGDDPKVLPDVSGIRQKHQDYLIAQYKLAVITEAINADENGKVWEPDYSNRDQWKYYPWFEVSKSGVGFSNASYDHWGTGTAVGSRLCFDTREKVYHIQKYFDELHLDQQLIRK